MNPKTSHVIMGRFFNHLFIVLNQSVSFEVKTLQVRDGQEGEIGSEPKRNANNSSVDPSVTQLTLCVSFTLLPNRND